MVSYFEEAPTLVCLCTSDSGWNTQGGRNYWLLVIFSVDWLLELTFKRLGFPQNPAR